MLKGEREIEREGERGERKRGRERERGGERERERDSIQWLTNYSKMVEMDYQ